MPGSKLTDAEFATSFEDGEPQPATTKPDLNDGADGALAIEVGAGPRNSPTSKPAAGFTGRRALHYGGRATSVRVQAAHELYSGLAIPVRADTRLSYLVHPELDDQHAYLAGSVALDLLFDDGTRLSALGARDQYGCDASAAGQSRAKILYADHWNLVQVDLGPVADGKTIDRVLLRVDHPAGAQQPEAVVGTTFGGWIDDLSIGAAAPDPDPDDPVAWVDTRRGTNAGHAFSRGNNLPITSWPNGFNFLTPMTDAGTHRWPYEYHRTNNADNRPELQGVGFSHQPSPWMGDRDQLILMPAISASELSASGGRMTPRDADNSAPDTDPARRGVAFDHDDEIARPDHYRVRLDGGLVAEMAPTDHGAIFCFGFPSGDQSRHLIFDTIDENARFFADRDQVWGWVDNGSDTGRTRMFYAGQFSHVPDTFGSGVGGHGSARVATFAREHDKVSVGIATSFISVEQARHNYDLELAGRTFDQVREAAHAAWHDRLSVLEIPQAPPSQLRTVYGCLYRLNLYPNSQFENSGDQRRPQYRYASPVREGGPATDTETGAVICDGKMYVNHGFWDTYRTAWPAYALLYPRLTAELADGFVQQYRDGGWIARWSAPGYADSMTGTSSDVAFADCYARGVELLNPLATYDAARKNATVQPPQPAVGRKGLQHGIFRGYVSNQTPESVSWALEGNINDFGLSMMAERLAADPAIAAARRRTLADEAAYFGQRALGYVHLFDADVGFFQGRRPDGGFAQSPQVFDPTEWGEDFTETDGWNFAFHVPHDGAGLAKLYGGPDGLEAKLDRFFATPESGVNSGSRGHVIHEMTEARAVRMGQFGISNQPSHHIPFLYNYTGAPHKAQAIVREVLQRLFTGERIGQGYPGDEDNGEMSAWYLLAALGLYPLRAGSGEYALVSPLFDRVVIRADDGNVITIETNTQTGDQHYLQRVRLNGRDHRRLSITPDELAGSRLQMDLGASPSRWGAEPADRPPALTASGERARPWTDLTAVDGHPLDAAHAVLFDDDADTQLSIGDKPVIGWCFGTAQTVHSYTLTSGDHGGVLTDWVLEGSPDGRRWERLDRRDNEVFEWRGQTRPFLITTPQPYRCYRLTGNTTPEESALAQVELLGRAHML